MEERRKEEGMKKGKEEREEERRLLSRLLSQLDSSEKDADTTHLLNKMESSTSVSETKNCGTKEVGMDDILKELKRVKRQNFITHCLLSIMIVVTATWQLSEASLLLSVKEKLAHPLKSVGDMITGTLKGRGKKPMIEAPPLPPIGVPELPNMDLPTLSFNGDED